jgi:hypothetical protein
MIWVWVCRCASSPEIDALQEQLHDFFDSKDNASAQVTCDMDNTPDTRGN